ncbi:MAG: hypothetical protein K9N34_10150 [Candidatus Marinimicrobia bacterium]|nr:hypothetical protein [Candidatus Neomarinimicrobiota bacterium]MCF7840925.1 hypothetical protein [Candidatus Neomarinimicrobiota bacterium]MCF7903377.1 hypothetical protein [Candidatus Neomarinimicrobiota bacterium]
MMDIFEEIRRVRGSDVDFQNHLRLNALFQYMSDAALNHAEQLHLGLFDLQKAGYFWVLAWARVEMTHFPAFNDCIKIRTWPLRIYKRFILREFLFKDASSGKELGRARTAWLIVSAESGRSVQPEASGLAFRFGNYESVMSALPERIPIQGNTVPVYSRQIRMHDIDVNRHVNNARYVEFLLDAYTPADFEGGEINTFTISFLAETRFGTKLDIKSARSGPPETDYLVAVHRETGKPAVQGLVTWQKQNGWKGALNTHEI